MTGAAAGRQDVLRGPGILDEQKTWVRTLRWPLWLGVVTLVTLALVSVVGRAMTLAGGEPFAPLYPMLPPAAVDDLRFLDRWFDAQAMLTWTHILLGGLVIAFAPVQFMPYLRRRHLRLHRWSGRVLLIAAIPTGLSGLLLQARSPYGGVTADSAIALFGALFLFALVRAYAAIRRGDVRQHREWMIRMLAVVLGVGAVRAVGPPLVMLLDRRPLELMGASFWLGLGLMVIAGEVWIRSTRVPSPPLAARVATE